MTTPDPCLEDETVARFVAGDTDAAELAAIERHLGTCAACAHLVAEYARVALPSANAPEPASGPSGGGSGEAVLEPSLPSGTVVGRYVLRALLGRGGAGSVYEAEDPQLKRRVALKILRPPPADLDRERALARQLGEAEAMARLQHPNVVAVHDAGMFDQRVFIVMELVEGETLNAWLQASPRSPLEVLRVFIAAGRGLQAAHAAGLVHRDFKPQNVVVGRDGRPRITDFGLARASAPARRILPLTEPGSAITVAGGTPLFMSPEQHGGRTATAASDQFSFALSLYRALCGRDPFGLPARTSWTQGQHADVPAPLDDGTRPRLPNNVEAVILRALAGAPEARWPSMDQMCDALEAASAPRRPGPVMKVATGFVALALLVGAVFLARSALGQRCGNGQVDPGEECDDGNPSNQDACLTSCRYASCGDGFVRAVVEVCDDGAGDPGCERCQRCGGGDAAYLRPADGHCYTRHPGPQTWDHAERACIDRGGTLVSYGSAAEATDVVGALVSAEPRWIGLRRKQPEFGYLWRGGEPWADPLPSWWAREQKPAGQDCVVQVSGTAPTPLRQVHIAGRWLTARCDERHGFVCESSPWVTRRPGNSAYRLFEKPSAYGEADRACRAIGAHLATLTDADEHAFVAKLVTRVGWIGGRTPGVRGPFSWSTGEPWAFTAFGSNEPDLLTRPGCVVVGNDRLWHDRACDARYPFICEVD